MDNDSQQNKGSITISATQKALIIFILGLLTAAGIYYFFKDSKIVTDSAVLSQDSFQGPTELSSTIQVTCQESAQKIFELKQCDQKESEFIKNAANCLNVYYFVDTNKGSAGTEGNYGDLSLQVADCYANQGDSNSKAVNFLKEINEKFDWDVYMGPISCDSKSTLGAHIESYEENRSFKCLKTSDLSSLVSEIKNRNFKVLTTMMTANDVAHQGIIEADVSCPEPFAQIEKNLLQMTAAPFEVTEPPPDTEGNDDIFIDVTRNNSRLLNLQFKIKTDNCLHFEALLAPSIEME
jgi:hypothetical protein